MAPLSQAIRTVYDYTTHDETSVYKGTIDPDWTIGAVPHGGYALAIVMQAAILHQTQTRPNMKIVPPYHPDPSHVTAQFISASWIGPLEVRVKPYSVSKRWTRLDLTLIQRHKETLIPIIRVQCHALFTVIPELPSPPIPPSKNSITVLPNTPQTAFTRQCPIRKHPSTLRETKVPRAFNFRDRMRWVEGVESVLGEEGIVDEDGNRKMEWGSWLELTDVEEDITLSAATIPFFADMFRNGPELLRKDQAAGSAWFPTMTFALDFKAKFPLKATPTTTTTTTEAAVGSTGSPVAKRTFGLYCVTKFIHEGRHDVTVEVWSSPCELSDTSSEKDQENWRRNSQILAISTQMALVVPYEVNLRKNRGNL